MSKELIRPEQYRKANVSVEEIGAELNEEQIQELSELLEGIFDTLQTGKLITGTVKKVDSDGVLVDINYKSEGLIPKYEFADHELKSLKAGDSIEVILDELESVDGNVILSYEKAKALKAWDEITKLSEEGKPVEGFVTHKVKGGLSVDIGIPAFLPGSQIDVQRITDFDKFVGQKITANIIKINKKRGNVIISRRKYLSDQRSESRKKILDKLKEADVIQGIVKNITNYGVFIDIGGVDGLLHITDMTWGRISHPSEMVKIGDQITVKVLSFDKENEKISLGLKQLTENPWEKLAKDLEVNSRVKGKISSITDYGLFVELKKGVEGLVHISEVSWTDRINDLQKKFKAGDEVEVLIVSLDPENRRMSLSIKQLEQNPWKSISDKFKVGEKISGTISNITDFGIFVQLVPGVDGLVHISDLSWTEHINHPSDIYKKGGLVDAVILGIDEGNKKISLGVKQLTEDPWEQVKENYPVGSIIEGEVSKTTNFGAFVKLPEGVEGLVHISELSDQNVEKVEDILKVGDKKQFRVINLNKDERKLGLSLKLQPTVRQAPAFAKTTAGKPSKKKEGREHKKAPRTQRPHVTHKPSSKPKSALQIALEEHAAKNNKDK
ncbi:30S ribosomal protein S1 [Candidatus Dependentiae bacterium]